MKVGIFLERTYYKTKRYMKINVERKTFIDAISVGGSMSGKTRSIPILEMSKVTIKDKNALISSFDGEVAITSRCGIVDSEGDIAFCINTRDWLVLLKSLKDDVVTFDIDNGVCVTKHSKGKFELSVADSDDFPTPSKDDDAKNVTISLDSTLLGDWAKVCKGFISQDDLRPILCGMYLYCKDGEVGCVATDTHKMYWNYINDSNIGDLAIDGVVTSKALDVLVGILGNGSDKVVVTFSENNITFKTQDAKLLCRKVEGKYPAFRSVIPQNNATTCKVALEDFKDAITRLNLMSGANKLIKLNIGQLGMNIESCDYDFGKSGSEEVACELNGSDLTIGVNGANILACVNAISDATTYMEMDSPQRPIVFKEENATMLLMPMRIS
jgi:DNA polymerase-3 subunit beta